MGRKERGERGGEREKNKREKNREGKREKEVYYRHGLRAGSSVSPVHL